MQRQALNRVCSVQHVHDLNSPMDTMDSIAGGAVRYYFLVVGDHQRPMRRKLKQHRMFTWTRATGKLRFPQLVAEKLRTINTGAQLWLVTNRAR